MGLEKNIIYPHVLYELPCCYHHAWSSIVGRLWFHRVLEYKQFLSCWNPTFLLITIFRKISNKKKLSIIVQLFSSNWQWLVVPHSIPSTMGFAELAYFHHSLQNTTIQHTNILNLGISSNLQTHIPLPCGLLKWWKSRK